MGDFARVDFSNDFARMLATGDFCQAQEVRFLDFGSGSTFNVMLRNPPQGLNPTGFRVTVYDEAGTRVSSIDLIHRGGHSRKLAISEVTDLQFGTLVFDFSA